MIFIYVYNAFLRQFFAVVFGLIYLNLSSGPLESTTIANISGVLFVFVTNMTFANMFPVVTVSKHLLLLVHAVSHTLSVCIVRCHDITINCLICLFSENFSLIPVVI